MRKVQTESSTSILDFLQQLRAERDELNATILGIEKRLGMPGQAPGTHHNTSNNPKTSFESNVSVDNIPVGFFHNLSQAAATEKLLRMNPGHPLSTGEILDAFRKSGMEVNAKNALTIIYTTLKRSPKSPCSTKPIATTWTATSSSSAPGACSSLLSPRS